MKTRSDTLLIWLRRAEPKTVNFVYTVATDMKMNSSSLMNMIPVIIRMGAKQHNAIIASLESQEIND